MNIVSVSRGLLEGLDVSLHILSDLLLLPSNINMCNSPHTAATTATRDGNWGSQFGPAKITTTSTTNNAASGDKVLDIGECSECLLCLIGQ